MMICVIHDTRDVARTRQSNPRGPGEPGGKYFNMFSGPQYPSSVECISDMKPFQILMMSVNRTALTRASIIINMYERIDKGQTVGFHKIMMRLHYLVFPRQ